VKEEVKQKLLESINQQQIEESSIANGEIDHTIGYNQ
jgi:hypothetical protein